MSLVYKYGIVEEEEADAINLPNGAVMPTRIPWGNLICHRFHADSAIYHQSPQKFCSMLNSYQVLFIFGDNLISGKTYYSMIHSI